jgi:hypothetical protein
LKLSEVKELKNIDSLAIHVITNHVEECFASNLVYKEFINLLDVCWSLNSSSVKIIYYGCLANLRNSSLDPETYEKVMLLLNKCPGLTAEYTRGVYDIALQTLSENSSSPVAKQLCLNAGRWHFGKTRPDNAPTIYDEQAIQNDILVRSS